MSPRGHAGPWLACLAASLLVACAHEQVLQVAEMGSFYVEGSQAFLPDAQVESAGSVPAGAPSPVGGEVEIDQIYVHFVRLRNARARIPVLMIPGGSLSGASYETTPDGRPGWQSNFLHAGYSVLLADTSQTGRSPWTSFPQLAPPPSFRANAFLWEVFRIGPPASYSRDARQRASYAASRFPAGSFDALARQVFPRFRPSIEAQRRAYGALLTRACPCIVLAHSAAGPPAVRAALDHPDLVKALILIEPSGGVRLQSDEVERLRSTPQLFVWGDNLGEQSWRELVASSGEDFRVLQRAGAPVSWLALPERQIRGNSHLLMMDDNSSEIAGLVIEWLDVTAVPIFGPERPPPRR